MKSSLLCLAIAAISALWVAPAFSGNTLGLELLPASPVGAGKTVSVTARLTSLRNGSPVAPGDLALVHTQKIHLLVIDPSLEDYHHLHPVPGKTPGEYVFDFTPRLPGAYRVWADVTPLATGKQEYVPATLGGAEEKGTIDKTPRAVATLGDYRFTLTLDGIPRAGEAVMGEITVAKEGRPFTGLEPVMGAFAHVVCFGEDGRSILHVHPMGEEPSNGRARGGPVLELHIVPKAAGFVKVFAQVRIDGRDLFPSFGIQVR